MTNLKNGQNGASERVLPACSTHHHHRPGSSIGNLHRRGFLAGLATVALSGCVATPEPARVIAAQAPEPEPVLPAMYRAMPSERFPIPAVDIKRLEPQLWRQVVDYPTDERVGTLIVDTPAKYLYLVREGGKAMRYGIGVGRDGFSWSGRAVIAYKREWPTWTPPAEMIERQPELAPYSAANGGMPPGLDNPLGARALYIFQDGRDTLYRLHGTNQAWSIGRAVSSGCIRLLNQDVIDLYGRVPDGTPIRVIPDPSTAIAA
ncbi:L,D-transpeptidase [Jiella pacifica]|uniref:L,D-transpeptidase family protein n=1 Tax=Jiella pacifica TaxID=2696469 RepID=A0A6N9T8T3_9HYPH|nr:L,D-transpeptidase [Jiella pacifica]NDW07847.1 L,D-transpeptidase family protein [Jiella pacifica]